MRKLNREFEVRLLVEILYEKGLIKRETYHGIIDELNRKANSKAA